MWSSSKLYLVLLAICYTSSIIVAEEVQASYPSCWKDGKQCKPDATCEKCCAGTSYTSKLGTIENKKVTVCGPKLKEKCLDDGEICGGDKIGYICDKCCNGVLDDAYVCGEHCSKKHNTICCDMNKDPDKQVCKCLSDGLADGTSCIPGESCYKCCNGAYKKKGWACGGKCTPDGTECTMGVDCHLCCERQTYWFSTGLTHCGVEPCYKDGESCVPDVSCTNCCSGAAYYGDGAICGGTCLSAGTECKYGSTCRKCCQDYGWVAAKGTYVCEPQCLKDGTNCTYGAPESCHSCCNGAYDNEGTTCGGKCLEKGTKCNFFGNCSMCCVTSTYDSKLKSYNCSEFDDVS
jgi:hypothetical protein